MISADKIARDKTSKAVIVQDNTALEEYQKKKKKMREQNDLKIALNILIKRVETLEKILGVDSDPA